MSIDGGCLIPSFSSEKEIFRFSSFNALGHFGFIVGHVVIVGDKGDFSGVGEFSESGHTCECGSSTSIDDNLSLIIVIPEVILGYNFFGYDLGCIYFD